MTEVKQCIICGVKGEVTEEGPCRHLRLPRLPKKRWECQMPTCRSQDFGDCIDCPHRKLEEVD